MSCSVRPYQDTRFWKLRSAPATSSSSAMESTPPFSALCTIPRTFSTEEKRGEPFLISSVVMASVCSSAARTSSGVSHAGCPNSMPLASGQTMPSAARARILSYSSASKYFSSIFSSWFLSRRPCRRSIRNVPVPRLQSRFGSTPLLRPPHRAAKALRGAGRANSKATPHNSRLTP